MAITLTAETDATTRPVAGTPYDFREPRRLGPGPRIDHNFVIPGDGPRTVAVLESPSSGLRMELVSDQPGLQVYTGTVS